MFSNSFLVVPALLADVGEHLPRIPVGRLLHPRRVTQLIANLVHELEYAAVDAGTAGRHLPHRATEAHLLPR
jgi:hypothetical protein